MFRHQTNRSNTCRSIEGPLLQNTTVYDDIIQFFEKNFVSELCINSLKEWQSFKTILESHDSQKIHNYVQLSQPIVQPLQIKNFNQENLPPMPPTLEKQQSSRKTSEFTLDRNRFSLPDPNISTNKENVFLEITQDLINKIKSNHTHIEILHKMNRQTELPQEKPILQENDINCIRDLSYRKPKRKTAMLSTQDITKLF